MKILSLLLVFCVSNAIYSQTSKKEVLFTINEKPFYTDEFVRVYNKNLDLVKDESQKDLDQYLELFLGYKLKVSKAYKLGLQNSDQYKNELATYRSQLAKNYTSDSKVTKELVQEGYNRLQKEVNAAHILILCDENAAASDTLIAYNKANALRLKIIAGADFETVAQAESEDPSAKENKGKLGYFSAFRMVYPFESAAFSTEKGSVSKIIRTKFGYHIIKILDVRANRGEIAVAHIMIMNSKDATETLKPKSTIDEIYSKLNQGEKFEDLAKQFSEDKSSSEKGGVLNRFGSGQLSSDEFEDVAFSLTKDNPISKPFQSQYGWHIVKLINKYPVKTFDESKNDIENKISKDDRSRLITNSLTNKLRTKYNIKTNSTVYNLVAAQITDGFYESKLEIPADVQIYDATLFTIEKQAVNGTAFLNYCINQQKTNLKVKPVAKLTAFLYSKFVDEKLNAYYNDNLEKEFPEFSAVIDEYRDGLLLFDLMEKEIWQRSKTDTLGLKSFYETVKQKHTWKPRAKLILLSSTKNDAINQALQLLNQGFTSAAIKEKLNTKESVNIMSTEGTFESGATALPKNITFVVGTSSIFKEGDYYYISKIESTLPAGIKTLDECKGKLINDYQQFLEQNWVADLKKEFVVTISKANFEKVKKQLKK